MPLVKEVLRTGIETNLKNKLLFDPKVKDSLRKKLDGGVLSGAVSGSNNLDQAHKAIKLKTVSILSLEYDAGGAAAATAEQLIQRITANELANAITEAMVEWMVDQIVPALALAVANNVDKFVRTATIITPAGQITAGASPAGPTTGATTTPSAPALIS